MQETHTSGRSSSDMQCAESGSGQGKQRHTLSIPKKRNTHAVSPALDKGKSKDERQAEKESIVDTVSKPGGYANDPDDPTNPNEVREKALRNLRR
jgi:hypothetical protein